MVHLPSAMTVTGKYHHRLTFYHIFRKEVSYKGLYPSSRSAKSDTDLPPWDRQGPGPSVRMATGNAILTSFLLVITFQMKVIIQVLIIGA